MIETLKNIYDTTFHRKTKRHIRVLFFFRKKITFIDYFTAVIDKGIYVVSIGGPLMTLPQIWAIYTTGNTVGLSLLTWIAYLVLTFFWLAYGYIHQDKPIIITQILWAFMYAFVTAQIVLNS